MPIVKALGYGFVPIKTLLKTIGVISPALATSATQNVMKGSYLTLEGGSVREYVFEPPTEDEQQVNVDVEFNEEALFTTAGFSTVAYIGAMTYFNSKLELKRRFKAIQSTIQFMIRRLQDAVDGIQDIEAAVIDEEIRLDNLRKNGATSRELLQEAEKGIRNIEQTLVFSGVENIDEVQAGLIRLQYLNNPYLDLDDLERQFPLVYARDTPNLKTWKRASKLVDKKLIDERIAKGKDIDLYKFLFATPDVGTEEIWSLEALTANFAQVIDDTKGQLVNARNIAQNAEEGRTELLRTLGFSDEADKSLLTTVDDFLFTSTTSITEATKSAIEYANELDIALEGLKKNGDEVIAIGAKASGKLVSRGLAILSVWDGVYWVGTSIVDIGLNFLGVPEEKQRIPILADIPYIGRIFDYGEDKLGGSIIDDLVITPLIDLIVSPFLPEEVQATLIDGIWILIATAATSETLNEWVVALLNFYVDNINADFEAPFAVGGEFEVENPLLKLFSFEPLAILEVMLYAVVAKIVFNAWVKPAYGFFAQTTGLGSTA